MQTKWFVRAGAGLFVAIVATVSVLEMGQGSRQPPPSRGDASAAIGTDPLRTELLHCQAIGQAGASDASCLRAWAANRRRFLAPGARSEVSPPPPGDSTATGTIPSAASPVGSGAAEGR
jgi:conjugative transfer region protein TrbK